VTASAHDIPGQARADDVRQLIEAAAAKPVELEVLSGVELCVLGGPKHVLFDEQVAKAWLNARKRARDKLRELAIEGLADRGLLISDRPLERNEGSRGATDYAVNPELGIVLAAKTRPAYAALCHVEGSGLRTMKMFALGDQEQPVQAIVVELPAEYPPGRFRNAKKLGVLGALYRYFLIAPAEAPAMLAKWAIFPPPGRPGAPDATRTVSVYSHREGRPAQVQTLSVAGDGTTAQIMGRKPGDPFGTCDLDRLQALMSILLKRALQ
jgi:hypothetical protein